MNPRLLQGTGLERRRRQQGWRAWDAGAIAATAAACLVLELETWPKPGLVSHIDNGSHSDMTAATFRLSAATLTSYLEALADAGARGYGMSHLRAIGLEAEAAMFAATAGVNTHRGAIFGLGLLCAAAGAHAQGRVDPAVSLGRVVAGLWGSGIADGPVLLHSHGNRVHRIYGAGGARTEAADGFPSVYAVGLPALQRGALLAPGDKEAARVEACFSLIAVLEDTNLLHRGGPAALRFARRTTRKFIEEGGVGLNDWRDRAQLIHRRFVALGLSPGGSADLLAMSLFVQAHETGAL